MLKLKELRIDASLSQSQLAQILNINIRTYAHWDNGRSEPDNNSLIKIANYFDVSLDYLLGRTEDINQEIDYLQANAEEVKHMINYRKLDKRDRKLVNDIIKSLLARQDAE